MKRRMKWRYGEVEDEEEVEEECHDDGDDDDVLTLTCL